MSRHRPLALAGLVALAVCLTACGGSADRQAAGSRTSPAATTEPAPTPTPSAVTPPAAAVVTSAPAATTPPPAAYDVAAVQQQLTAQKYYLGPVDGKPGAALRSAVMAFQKVNGLSADGSVGPATLKALQAPRAPVLKGGPANRVEVDLTKQVLYVVKAGQLVRTLPVSSGNGRTYSQKGGGTATALTPVGTFTITRRIIGVHEADLGTLYDPQYFYKGWAIHGSNSVPAGPASHGCVRVTRADATWLLGQINVGTTVSLYGGSYTFTAGSKAAGTDNPTGDDAATTPPSPTRAPAPPVAPPVVPTTPAVPASPTPTGSGTR